MKKKKVAVMMTPWYSQEEWERVRGLVLDRDSRAVDLMSVWRCRVSRLPAGVETTLALLSALCQGPHTPLSLGTAVNRFLNHVGHLGMNTWGLTKLHEAAEKVSVPEWLVQVRHETTHGNMPSLTVLRAALEFGLAWLDVNYWNCSRTLSTASPEDDCSGSLESLLDLHLYLKLYQMWGTERMSELAEQAELWCHLSAQWNAVTAARPTSLHSLTVRQAVGRVKTEVCSLLDRDSNRLDLLADILVREDLLVPSREFLDSLETEEDSTEVPAQLVQIWSEFLTILDREGGVPGLISRLLERAGNGCQLSAGWVQLLAEALLGDSWQGSGLNIKACSVSVERLESWLSSPGPATARLCPLLCRLAQLPRNSQQSVQALVNIMVGDSQGQHRQDLTVFSLSDLVEGKAADSTDTPDSTHSSHTPQHYSSWTLLPQPGLDSQPLGFILGGHSWESLWVEAEWSPADRDSEEEETVPQFDISPIDWSTAPGMRTSKTNSQPTPHFYSNVQQKQARYQDQQESFRRRKRLKKS